MRIYSWDELDSSPKDFVIRLALQLQQEEVKTIEGLAEKFPRDGWTTDPHPELGDVEPFSYTILSKVKVLIDSIVQAEARAQQNAFSTEEAEQLAQRRLEDTKGLAASLRASEAERQIAQGAMRRAQAHAEELALKGAAVSMAIGGHTDQLKDIVKGHPYWTPDVQAARELREAAAMAVYIANRRVIRAKKFMEPESLGRLLFVAQTDQGEDWDGLHPGAQDAYRREAEFVTKKHSQAIDKEDCDDDPDVKQILTDGDSLEKAIALIEVLKSQMAECSKLCEELASQVPPQPASDHPHRMD